MYFLDPNRTFCRKALLTGANSFHHRSLGSPLRSHGRIGDGKHVIGTRSFMFCVCSVAVPSFFKFVRTKTYLIDSAWFHRKTTPPISNLFVRTKSAEDRCARLKLTANFHVTEKTRKTNFKKKDAESFHSSPIHRPFRTNRALSSSAGVSRYRIPGKLQ